MTGGRATATGCIASVIFMVGALALPAAVRADVRPHALIGDGMVLQRQREVNIGGTADAGERVVVRFRGREAATTADAAGRWQVRIDSQAAGGPFPLTIAGKNTVTLSHVLVGEVWICSGQSNMGWPVAARPGSAELAGTENPSIRLFQVPQRLSDEPQSELEGSWRECGPTSLVGFSAVAYYFGRQIAATQNVPVGLIHASYGGSGVQAWLSAQALAEDPELAPLRAKRARAAEEAVANLGRLRPEIERYHAAVAQAKAAGTPPPQPPRGMVVAPSSHSRLYNGMIAPLTTFGIRGVVWYQGEADVGQADDYQSLFSALIRSWRRAWNQGDFPFLFVQLAPYRKMVERPQESDWARLREAQFRTSRSVPQTGMAVITDWGHETDIHVKQKRPVGERLALVARALVYGEKLEYSGPLFDELTVRGREAIVGFTHVGAGLIARPMVLENITTDGRGGTGGALHVAAGAASAAPVPLQGFEAAGDDKRFFPAQGEIRGATVVVTSPEVAQPTAVRYGWADYPRGNLFNVEGLPASPFRTDAWPAAAPAVQETPRAGRGDRGR